MESLSARRAWIEIGLSGVDTVSHQVALRKESVDRNLHAMEIIVVVMQSLSARRAWIEISLMQCQVKKYSSLSARRAWIEIMDDLEPSKTRRCRSPQGERG